MAISNTDFMHLAEEAQIKGQIEKAERLYKQVPDSSPDYAIALLRIGQFQAGRMETDAAIASFESAISVDPAMTDAHISLIQFLQSVGRRDQCLAACERARGVLKGGRSLLAIGYAFQRFGAHAEAIEVLERSAIKLPISHEPFYALGFSLLTIGEADAAIDKFRKALENKPDNRDAKVALAESFSRAGRTDEAVAFLRGLIDEDADRANALAVAGDILSAGGAIPQAEEMYTESLEVSSGTNGRAALGLGRLYLRNAQLEAAVGPLELACSLAPKNAAAHFDRALALRGLMRNSEAIEAFRVVLRLEPNNPGALANIGTIARDEGDMKEAARNFALAAHSLSGEGDRLRLKAALTLPVIYDSDQHIEEVRFGLHSELKALHSRGMRLDDPVREVGEATFYLAYHGRDNLDLMRQIAATHLGACPSLGVEMLAKRGKRKKIKVGFISTFFHGHTVGRVTEGLIRSLSRDRFEVVVIKPLGMEDEVAARIDQAADKLVQIPLDLERARQAISDESLDILFYTDIGMDPLTYFLAFSRLAPVQVAGWGHPDTTGIPNVDYYLSAESFEPAGSETQYSERLAKTPNIYAFIPPPDPVEATSRREFGLPDKAPILFCPQAVFKIHPQFDLVIRQILLEESKAELFLSEGVVPKWSQLLMARLKRTIPEVVDRIQFMPRISADRFPAYLSLADALLDPLHFTGGYTSYLALAAGAPIVTWQGDHMRGRMTHGLYSQMGFSELSASSTDEYVQLALRLVRDKSWRNEVREEIKASSSVLFNDGSAVSSFEEFLASVKPK